jgi:chromosomal replication initiation ATPase DnaA
MLNLHGETEAILNCICSAYGVTRAAILGSSRQHPVGEARIIGYYLARRRGMSYPRIGRVFGRDHTTAMSGVKRAARIIERDPAVLRMVVGFLARADELAGLVEPLELEGAADYIGRQPMPQAAE